MKAKKLTARQSQQLAAKVVKLGQLSMLFAQTYRVTQLPSGEPESDTDHTFMLSLIACSLAADYDKALDVGKVAQYALVHDLVEVYAKDTPTVNINAKELAAKQARETAAYKKIKSEFGKTFPWIPQTIEAYEKLADPESRFIKVLDKGMPAITHLFNDATYLRSIGIDSPQSRQLSLATLDKRLKQSVSDQPLAHAIRDALEAEISKLFQ